MDDLDDGDAPAESHEVYIWPSDPAQGELQRRCGRSLSSHGLTRTFFFNACLKVDKIFEALSQCASLHASYGDQAPGFIAESDYAAEGQQQDLDPQAARFAAMGLDPDSLVYATADGNAAGPGLEGQEDREENGDGQWDDVEEDDRAGECAVAEDDEDDELTDARTMQEVIPGLWIGDYQAAQDHNLLQKRNIVCVVSASRSSLPLPTCLHPLISRSFTVRQEYEAAPGVNMRRVAVDDTDRSNIIEHFVPTAEFIRAALARNDGAVLVHCQAGVSRSTTLVAAYLMSRHGLNVEQAIERIRAARPQVDPSEFFMTQLELFERCNCEWDPVRVSSCLRQGFGGESTDSHPPFSARETQYPEERRFLMSFAQAQIMGEFRSL